MYKLSKGNYIVLNYVYDIKFYILKWNFLKNGF